VCTKARNQKLKEKRTKNKNGYRVCSEEMVPGQKLWSQSRGRKRKARVEKICGTGRFCAWSEEAKE